MLQATKYGIKLWVELIAIEGDGPRDDFVFVDKPNELSPFFHRPACRVPW